MHTGKLTLEDGSIDDEVVKYLDTVSSYKNHLDNALELFKEAYIELSRAKTISRSQGVMFLNTQSATSIIGVDGVLHEATPSEQTMCRRQLFGVWPPSSVSTAQGLFVKALQAIYSGHRAGQTANELADELQARIIASRRLGETVQTRP